MCTTTDRLRRYFVPEVEVAYTPSEEQFPKRECFILACVVLSSALSMTGLFPYVAFMVSDFKHVEIDKAGYYAGYVASSMMFGRLLSSVFWGRLSDRIGRKPVMYVGCCSIIVFSVLFGFSTNFWMALITRFLLGLFNPVISVAKTVVSEVCAPKHQAIGMSLNIGCWSVGLVVGPAIGGLLCQPAKNYPHVFGHSTLLKKFPYLIPNLITASLAVFSLILLAAQFPETLKRTTSTSSSSIEMIDTTKNPIRLDDKLVMGSEADADMEWRSTHGLMDGEVGSGNSDSGDDDDIEGDHARSNSNSNGDSDSSTNGGLYSIVRSGEVDKSLISRLEEGDSMQQSDIVTNAQRVRAVSEDEVQGISSYALYKTNGVWQAINSQILLAFVSSTINELVPLWAVSSRSRGGLNFTSVHLGTIMTICGAGLFLSTVFLYPFMVGRFGVLITYLTGVFCMAPVLIALSFSSSKLLGLNKNEEFTVVVCVLLLVKVCDSCTFASLSTIVNQSVDASQRGLVNGLTMTLSGIGQTTGAILAANGYAWSINNNLNFPFDSHFMFLVLSIICLINGTSFYLLKRKQELNDTAAVAVMVAEQALTSRKDQVKIDTRSSLSIDNTRSSNSSSFSGTGKFTIAPEDDDDDNVHNDDDNDNEYNVNKTNNNQHRSDSTLS